YAQPVSTKAIFAKALKRRHHSAASVNPMTLLRPRSFSLPPIPRGSQAKRYVSREAFVRRMRKGLQKQQQNNTKKIKIMKAKLSVVSLLASAAVMAPVQGRCDHCVGGGA